MHSHLAATLNAARYAEMRADAERRRSQPRSARRRPWRGRRSGAHLMRARAA